MAVATFVHVGRMIDYTPSVAVAAGDVIVQNELVGVANVDIEANRLGALAVEGVFDFPKPAATAIGVGKPLFWSVADAQASEDPSGILLGKSVAAAGASDATVRVKLAGQAADSPIKVLEGTFLFDDFTDNLNESGYVDFSGQLPAGALVLGWKAVVPTPFTGDVSAVMQVGSPADVDRFSEVVTSSVFTAGTVGSNAPATGANAFVSMATTPRITVTSDSDFGLIAGGEMTVSISYLQL